MLVFLLMHIKMKLSFSQSCCNNYDKNAKIVMNADQDYGWNFEVTMNQFPLGVHTNLMTIKQNSQFEIAVVIVKSEKGFQYALSKNENKQFQNLETVQLGVFQQIFIQSNMNNLEFEWYSDFKMTQNHTFLMLESHLPQIIFNQEILCYQQIRNIDKHLFIRDCESRFHIKIQLYPQLKYIRSQQFNNNYYSLSFWVKQIQNHSNKMNLQIQQLEKEDEFLKMGIFNNQIILTQNDNLIYVDQYDKNGWVFFQLTYQHNQRTLQYQRQEQLQNISFDQSYSQYIRLFIWPEHNIIFTGVQLHLTRQNNIILCVPGCLSCDQQGYCLQCEDDLIQNGNFCECKENLQFFFFPSECYIKLDYQILSKNKRNINCPQFGGQQCPQCQDDSNQDFRYCLYLTNIQLQYNELELEHNYYHIFIPYKVEENSYLTENTNNQNYQEFSDTNIIYFYEKLYDFYQIGLISDYQKKCYNGYYYHIRCRQINKQCRIQEEINNCNICHENYVLLNGKCSKCPYNCQYCQMNQKTQMCLKCQKGYFLNFQRKCIRCNIENCQQCYHYNGQLNTLERNFQIQKSGFIYFIGCSYCQDNYSPTLDKRECSQIDKEQNTIQIAEKFYLFDLILQQLTSNSKCGQQINQCYLCQNDFCLLCNQNYILNVQTNKCIQKQYNYTIYNQNIMIQDYDSQYNLLTFLYFKYNYTDIITQQKQFYLKDCQFNNYKKIQRIDQISCFSELYDINNNNQCPFYCNSCLNNLTCLDYKYLIKFNITFTVLSLNNNTYLNNSNNFISNLNSVYFLENNQNQFTIQINKISSSLGQFFQEINQTEKPYTQAIQFNNTNFLNDDYLPFNQPVIIENSILNIYKSLHVGFNQSHEEITFKITNSQLIGQTNQSKLKFVFIKPWKIKIENLIISNLSSFYFLAESKFIYISNLTLINLNLQYQKQNLIRSYYLRIESLLVKNCTLQNTVLFSILCYNISISNLTIVSTIFRNSTFMDIGGGNSKFNQSIQIQNLFMFQIEQYNSNILYAMFCFSINLYELLVEQSISIDSKLIHLLKFNTVLLKNFSFIDNQLINTSLIFVFSFKIFQKSVIIQRNNVSNQGDYFINYQGEKLNIIELQYEQIQVKGINFLFLYSDIIFIDDMKLFNITFENLGENPVIIIDSKKEIQIKNLKLINLKTQATLIEFRAASLHLDNFILRNIQIMNSQKYINLIDFFIQLKLVFQVICIDTVDIEGYQLRHRLFQIQARNFTLFNCLIQNLICPNIIIFQTANCAYMNMSKLQATNVSALVLLDTYSAFSIITQLNFDQVQFTQFIINCQPQNTQNYFFLTNLNIISSYLSGGIISMVSGANLNSFIELKQIRAKNIQSKTIFNIKMSFSIASIKDIIILQSHLDGILQNEYKYSLLTLSNIKIKKVNSHDFSIFAINVSSTVIYLSQIQVEYCQNVAFYIYSHDFKIENLIFADSQIRFLLFQQKIYIQIQNHQSIFRNIYIVNNIQIINNSNNLIFFNFTENYHFIQGLAMFNNTSKQKGYLLAFSGKFILQILQIDNHCKSQCLFIHPNSIILLRYYSDQIKTLQQNQYFIDKTSKLIQLQKKIQIQMENFQMKIQINNKIQINDMKLFYIPSGQKLIEYKVYDMINFQLDDYIESIQLVQYQNNKIDQIQGTFIINTYEYDQIQQKIIRSLNEYQNFFKFQQTGQESELNNFKIIYNPYEQNILMIEIYKADDPSISLKVYAKTQLCQIGEILVKNQCLVCNPELQIYSTKQKSNFCSIVDYSMISKHKQGSIKLNVGYWRPFIYSSKIEKCESKQNCQGGWHTGDNSCKIGYIGGNCNACDSFNVRGNGYYQLESQECKLCGEFNYFQFVFKVLLIIMIYFVRLFFQMNSNIQNYRKLLLQRLVNSRYYFILLKFISDRSSLVLNILIRNFALLSIIISDILDLPEILTVFTNPMILEKNTKLCLNTFVDSNHQNWIIASKIIITILAFNLYITIIVISNQKQMKNYFLFPLISLFLFQGPTIAVLSIQQTIYVTYSNVRYAYFDNAIRYFSYDHQRNLTYFTLHLIIFFTIVFPFLIFLIMKRQSRNLFKGRTFIQLGNFILPYRYYYQELINYFRNIMLLQLLLLNLKMLTKIDKIMMLVLIIYFYNQIQIYKIKLISHYETQQGIILIVILYLSYHVTNFEQSQDLPILLITSFHIILSFKQYIYYLFKDNKLQIYELLQNRRKILHYLNMQNYDQCLNNWKKIKLDHQYLVQQGFRQDQERNTSHIILQTQNTQEINNSLREYKYEIEMREL